MQSAATHGERPRVISIFGHNSPVGLSEQLFGTLEQDGSLKGWLNASWETPLRTGTLVSNNRAALKKSRCPFPKLRRILGSRLLPKLLTPAK
jgi:hypothetical protein